MNIEEVLKELDALDHTQVESFLIEQMKEANDAGDNSSRITLLNEMIGFCRDSCQFSKCRIYSNELLTLLDDEGLEGTQAYATSLLNIANADRASADYEESEEYYLKAYDIYEQLLDPKDFLFASINNNLSLLYQEMKQYEKSCEALKKALYIIEFYSDKDIEKAITLTNLAQSQLRLGRYEDGKKSIEAAMDIFIEDGERDYHYSGALGVYGELLFCNKEYSESAKYYSKAMEEFEKHMGRNANYDILKSNRDEALEMAGEIIHETEEATDSVKPETSVQEKITGLAICKKYYEEVGAAMIHEKFPKFESRIAVGLVGEGSDCFGFDDETSRDHDWGPGFCMWVDDVTYEAIGEQLQAEYEKLPAEYMGMRRMTTKQAQGRVGVIRIREFYSSVLKLKNGIPRSEEEWLSVNEEDLATATNGQIFRDDDGIFFSLRNTLLAYYPETVFRKKLAYELVKMAQTGQYNLTRCIKRGDRVTATMYLAEYMEHTFKTLFLLNRKYAPYKKWYLKSASRLNVLPEITDILIAISDMDIADENVAGSIEIIAKLIINELKNQKLIIVLNRQDPYYLEPYGRTIINSINYLGADEAITVNPTVAKHTELVDTIVALEWEAFDKTQNEGGRASCQDDWETFSIMRKSQYMTWTNEMLESFIGDFEEANSKGWNLITEKYGRMEASTAPEEYEKIKNSLPGRDEQQLAIVEEIVKVQVEFMEQFAEDYPNIAAGARSIHTYEDTECNTSYETYLRGELLTYSPQTLNLYGQYVISYVKQEKNLAYEIMNNTARLYGYSSVDELEKR